MKVRFHENISMPPIFQIHISEVNTDLKEARKAKKEWNFFELPCNAMIIMTKLINNFFSDCVNNCIRAYFPCYFGYYAFYE